ncbi:MAG: cytochrome c3 family protein [Isosphaeraceae bacterium]
MGRSLQPVEAFIDSGAAPGWDRLSFADGPLSYGASTNSGRLTHVEALKDVGGQVLARNRGDVRFVLGSGQQAMSFLVERGEGYLFASPVTFYTEGRSWDLSPGYRRGNPHFERPVRPGCLYCHANQAELVEGTENRYRPPFFRGHAIGCERCHGPGADHVRAPDSARGIVNPADLEPPLREGVCQQCHLQAEARILRAGRWWTDYRPGRPLHEFIDVYLKTDQDGQNRFIGQVEQMYASRCFRESRGTLGCISCHDPHREPRPEERVRHFRDRCLGCHARDDGGPTSGSQGSDAGPCSLSRAERTRQNAADSCIDCHMPRSASRRILHTATTDHTVPRDPIRPHPPGPDDRPGDGPPTNEAHLASFFRELRQKDRDAGREPETERGRDLGLALSIEAPDVLPQGGAPTAGTSDRLALGLLEASLARRPEDVDAWEARGRVLGRLGEHAEAWPPSGRP